MVGYRRSWRRARKRPFASGRYARLLMDRWTSHRTSFVLCTPVSPVERAVCKDFAALLLSTGNAA